MADQPHWVTHPDHCDPPILALAPPVRNAQNMPRKLAAIRVAAGSIKLAHNPDRCQALTPTAGDLR
ncbi:hypothetical protein [Candidatus Entotheonella palauensis]|uniref:hypothetical protein n=1 Tax=Candidatus Entotheonella palauensis TaxID=93172 RepID=UPI001177B56E|nr:hypothetical protein [Candidatus Entotheonella palauensis]